jgi:hypothetical protein
VLDALVSAGEALPEPVRVGLVLVTTAVLVWWTYRRAVGDGDDPSISVSTGGLTGSFSFLVSGVVAVAFVAGGWILGFGPEIAEKPALALIPLAFVAAHAFIEVRES